MRTAFVVRPFRKKKDDGRPKRRTIDFDCIQEKLIDPALASLSLCARTTGEIVEAGNIREDMFRELVGADLVICDVTLPNANVFYELGIRHALVRSKTVLIRGANVEVRDGAGNLVQIPFNIRTDRLLNYDLDAPEASVDALAQVVRATLAAGGRSDSPVFVLMPELPDIDRSFVYDAPQELVDEIERVKATEMSGWLRLLHADAKVERFHVPATRRLARAMIEIGDVTGASQCYQHLVEVYDGDLDAKIALAEICLQRYVTSSSCDRASLLSDMKTLALKVEQDDRATPAQRATAIGLRGAHDKKRWRERTGCITSDDGRLAAARDPKLHRAYERLRRSCLTDLNLFRASVAALQLGTVLQQTFAASPEFEALLDDGGALARQLADELPRIREAAGLALSAADATFDGDTREARWVPYCAAELAFVTLPNEDDDGEDDKVRSKFHVLDPEGADWQIETVLENLKIMRDFGVRKALADELIDHVQALARSAVVAKESVVVFFGHMVAGRERPSGLDPAKVMAARERIKGRLKALSPDLVYASAAPGADILCHEICRNDLGVESVMCLRFPEETYFEKLYGFDDFDWWNRFCSLRRADHDHQLYRGSGPPDWLHGREDEHLDRGNLWLLEMAAAVPAKSHSVVALHAGAVKGSTIPDAVRHAQRRGFFVEVIDASDLLRDGDGNVPIAAE